MPVTDADQRQVIDLLLGDLHATIGTAHDQLVFENATRLQRFIDETDKYIERVILTGFTTVGGGVEKDGILIATLGSLSSTKKDATSHRLGAVVASVCAIMSPCRTAQAAR